MVLGPAAIFFFFALCLWKHCLFCFVLTFSTINYSVDSLWIDKNVRVRTHWRLVLTSDMQNLWPCQCVSFMCCRQCLALLLFNGCSSSAEWATGTRTRLHECMAMNTWKQLLFDVYFNEVSPKKISHVTASFYCNTVSWPVLGITTSEDIFPLPHFPTYQNEILIPYRYVL